MRIVTCLAWLPFLAVLSSCEELLNNAGDCPSGSKHQRKKVRPVQGGLVLMQKGISLSQLKPQMPEAMQPALETDLEATPALVESLKPKAEDELKAADIKSWVATVVNASKSAAAAYEKTLNASKPLSFKTTGRGTHYSFMYKHWSLVLAVAFVLASAACVAIFDIRWNRKQKAQEHDCNLEAQVERFSHRLVGHLLPSAKIDRHQFRGFTRKASSITLGFENLGLEIPGHGKVLEGVSGEFKAGRMTIILGPSGAGKTTFMNCLCGKATYGQMSGKILVNGVEASLSDFKSVVGFVPQDDIVHEKLTVREQIHFSSQLRNVANTSPQTLCHIVDDVLAVLQIEHIQRSTVGSVEDRGVSGGQRKRVNIGLELAAFPTLLFLDEPTSGLDSTSSLALVKSLKKMTQLGMTIVVVAHQPRWSLFSLFDDVLILGKGGHTAYLGPSPCVAPYFESLGFKKPSDENLADWFMDIVSGSVPNPNWPKFSSEMLVKSWVDRDRDAVEQSKGRLRSQATRIWTAHDDRAVLAQALDEEWAKVDTKREGSLSTVEMVTLLLNTAGERPSDEVAEELVIEMAGQGAKSVAKAEFVDYFVALEQVVTASAKPYIDTVGNNAGGSAMDLLSLPDLHRAMPGFFEQYVVIIRRRMVQVSRNNKQRCIDVCLIMVVALFIGWLNRGQMTFRDQMFASKILVFHLGLCLLITVSCLRTFGMDRLVWWREFSSGLSVGAFYCARMTIDTLDVCLQCVLYTSMFYLLAQPAEPFRVYFLPCLYLSFAASGWGYFISAVCPPANSSLVAILFMLVTAGFLGDPGAAHGYLSLCSMTRWSAQMTYLATADLQGSFLDGGFPNWVQEDIAETMTKTPPDPLDVFKACGFMSSSMVEAAYRTSSVNNLLGHWYSASLVLLTMAIVLRLLAYWGMRFVNRSKYA